MERVATVIGICLLLGLFSGAAGAQDIRPLGVTGAEVGLGIGGIFPERDQPRLASSLSLDVAITDYHGVQGDLSFEGIGNSFVGRIAGHLFLVPRDDQRYGVFAMLGDVDDRSFSYATAGVEGQFDLSNRMSVEGRVGLGAATSEKLDFIFGGFGAAWEVSPSLELRGHLDVAQFDEIGLTATLAETYAGLRWQRPDGGPAIDVGIQQETLTGRDDESSLRAGLTWRFGAMGGETRPFHVQDPVAPLLRRGLY